MSYPRFKLRALGAVGCVAALAAVAACSSSGSSSGSASSNSNSGTVTVTKGTTLTVGGTSNSYNQTAGTGTTTVDGTLSGGTTGSAKFTGGKILGAGTVKANTSVGNASGTAVTINVGDSGKAGLLAITGTYTQLATGTMNVSIGGTRVGTQYSQLPVSGVASLGGTLTAASSRTLILILTIPKQRYLGGTRAFRSTTVNT